MKVLAALRLDIAAVQVISKQILPASMFDSSIRAMTMDI